MSSAPKYNVGDYVYYCDYHHFFMCVVRKRILDVHSTIDTVCIWEEGPRHKYGIDGHCGVEEADLYATKDDAVKAFVAHCKEKMAEYERAIERVVKDAKIQS